MQDITHRKTSTCGTCGGGGGSVGRARRKAGRGAYIGSGRGVVVAFVGSGPVFLASQPEFWARAIAARDIADPIRSAQCHVGHSRQSAAPLLCSSTALSTSAETERSVDPQQRPTRRRHYHTRSLAQLVQCLAGDHNVMSSSSFVEFICTLKVVEQNRARTAPGLWLLVTAY